MHGFVKCLLIVGCVVHGSFGYQFRFDVPDNDEECFGQEVDKDTVVHVDYRVMTGGNLDIDVVIQSPSNSTIYDEKRNQQDNFQFTTTEQGAYLICFSNQFSTITHKNVFLSLKFGEDKPVSMINLPDNFVTGPLTFMETTSGEIYENLEEISEYQTRFRLQEAQSRLFAEDLNERVLWWSIMQTFMIVVIAITQVMILRNFFDTPLSKYPVRPRQSRYAPIAK